MASLERVPETLVRTARLSSSSQQSREVARAPLGSHSRHGTAALAQLQMRMKLQMRIFPSNSREARSRPPGARSLQIRCKPAWADVTAGAGEGLGFGIGAYGLEVWI